MNSSRRSLLLSVTLSACGSNPPATLGDAQELLVRAVRVGIDAKESPEPSVRGPDVLQGGGEGWVGPCNCRIMFSYRATLEHQLKDFDIALADCRKNVALDRVFALVDPLFQREHDRAAFHALLASPPTIDGASPSASTSATRTFSTTVVRGNWESVVWKELPLRTAEDRAFMEENVFLSFSPRTHDNDTEETKASDLNSSSYLPKPAPCRDGSTRPWERQRPTPSGR